jgi:hypothetical protein
LLYPTSRIEINLGTPTILIGMPGNFISVKVGRYFLVVDLAEDRNKPCPYVVVDLAEDRDKPCPYV